MKIYINIEAIDNCERPSIMLRGNIAGANESWWNSLRG